jgi:hypothetical protein
VKSVVVAAYRPASFERARNWEYARERWSTLGWPIRIADTGAEPFSRAGSRNLAARYAGDWDVALIVDADAILADLYQATAAASMARATGRLAYAHDHLTMLEAEQTELVLGGARPELVSVAARLTRHPHTWSSVLAVPRPLWEQVGGYDERFVDWGYEDLAFMSACWSFAGRPDRIPGDAYHLWHPRSWEQNEGNPSHPANQTLGQRYLDARSRPEAMREILDER